MSREPELDGMPPRRTRLVVNYEITLDGYVEPDQIPKVGELIHLSGTVPTELRVRRIVETAVAGEDIYIVMAEDPV